MEAGRPSETSPRPSALLSLEVLAVVAPEQTRRALRGRRARTARTRRTARSPRRSDGRRAPLDQSGEMQNCDGFSNLGAFTDSSDSSRLHQPPATTGHRHRAASRSSLINRRRKSVKTREVKPAGIPTSPHPPHCPTVGVFRESERSERRVQRDRGTGKEVSTTGDAVNVQKEGAARWQDVGSAPRSAQDCSSLKQQMPRAVDKDLRVD